MGKSKSKSDEEDKGEEDMPILILRDKRSKAVTANVVPTKGEDDYAIHSTIMEQYALYGCELNATELAIRQPDGCEVTVGWGCSMNAPKFARHQQDIERGHYRGGRKIA